MNYKDVFEQLPGSFAIINAEDFTIENHTNFHEKILNAKRETVVGKPLFERFPAGEENHIYEALKNVISTKKAYKAKNIRRYDIDGIEKYWSLEYNPVLDSKDEKVAFVIISSIDITHLVKNNLTLYNVT